MRSAVLIPTLLGLAASPAMAQDVSFVGADLSYLYLTDDDDNTGSVLGIEGDIEVMFDSFYGGVWLDRSTIDFGGGDEFTSNSYGLAAGYMIVPGALVGAGLTGFSISSGGGSETHDGYEVFGQYQTEQFGVAARYDKPVPDESDFYFLQVFGEANPTQELTIGAIVEILEGELSDVDPIYYLNAEYDSGPIFVRGYFTTIGDSDVTVVGARGHYEFAPNIRATAAVQSVGDDGSSIEAYAIGGGYMVTDGVWIDASLGQISGDGESLNSFGFSLSYETGTQTRLDRKMIGAVRQDYDDGYLGIFPSLPLGVGGYLD